MAARTGACRCGRLRYQLTCELGFTFHCHCSFCRRIHGSAFTTVALVPRAVFRWSAASAEPEVFVTLVVGSLDDQRDVAPWAHLNTESKAPWFEIADALPQFAAFPSTDEIDDLARRRRREAAR
jgi:hypothetical protein